MPWTKAQNDAINARNSNILVSAAAGSGKTAVLVERVIKLITDKNADVNIDELLVVTFTNAAAAEMKSRISARLEELLSLEPNNTNILKQLSLLPNAKICTIDSFCINLVREYFFRLDIAQDFNILEETQKAVIEQEAIEAIVDELYESGDESFKALVELLSTTKSDSDLISSVKRLDNYITAQPFPFKWLSDIAELYNPATDLDASPLKVYAVEELKYTLDYLFDVINGSFSVLAPDDEMFDKYTEMLNQDKNELIRLANSLDKTWDEIKETLSSLVFSRAPSKRGYESEAKSVILENRKQYCGKSSVLNSDIMPIFSPSAEDFKNDNILLYPILQKLIELVKAFHEKCFEMKKELNAYSFSDIEHFAIELLFSKDENENIIKSDIALDYQDNFKEILVDEYQDTNTAQDKLFEMLSNGFNRFMVGDVKQSIYRFRLAMPQIFNSKKDSFEAYSAESKATDKKIILDRNFRSDSEICDFVNYLFSRIMTRRVGELDYNEEEYLNCETESVAKPYAKAQFNIVDVPEDEDVDEYEARQIARLINAKVNGGETVNTKSGERPVKYGDFAVLLRSTKGRIDVYTKVFSEFGIPVLAGNRTNLFENNEVAVLISLLRTIDNPTQDIPLLATLMSVFYGYSADDIANARIEKKRGNLYSAICAREADFSAFLGDLEKYREYASSMSVENSIRRVLSETSYLSVISAMGNYEQRRLNVMKLISLAKSFDTGEYVGLTAFIRFIDSIIENNITYESADLNSFDDNSVKIMSVHKSKGLEFPVCILAGSSHKYNFEDLRSLILLNNTYGIGLKVTNEEGLYRYNSLQYTLIKNANAYASMSENLRVLYVAITRAKDQFIAFASYKNACSKINSISKKLIGGKIPPYAVKKAQSDAEILIMCSLLHPDGKLLREQCENTIQFDLNEKSRLSVSVISDDVKPDAVITEQASPDPETVEKIRERLSFVYDKSELSAFSAKRNASSLDEKEQSFRFFAAKQPSFISDNTLTGAEKGTAMHTFMQYCDYNNAVIDLNKEIERLKSEGFISEIQAESLNREKLNAFFGNEIAIRIMKADVVYREMKLASFVPVSEVENTALDDEILVQGVADLVFEEKGKLVLVDYKTDYVSNEDELLKLYKKQLGFYKYAAERTLNKPVKEAMLYSFSLNKCCEYK